MDQQERQMWAGQDISATVLGLREESTAVEIKKATAVSICPIIDESKQEGLSMPEYLYRYHDWRCSAGVDEFDNPLPGYHLEFCCHEYEIIKKTPKGAWIKMFMDKPKFVLLTARKRFACPTKEEALDSMIARKKAYIKILDKKMAYTNHVLRRCEEEKKRLKADFIV